MVVIYHLRMFLRRLLGLDLVPRALEVINTQTERIQEWMEYSAQQELQHTRNVRDLVQNFLIVQQEEIDVREELEKGLQDLNDHVARLEEHAPSRSR